jgi:hypothetical protein
VNSFNFIVDPNDLDLSYSDGKFRGYIAGSDSGEALMGVGVFIPVHKSKPNARVRLPLPHAML